MKSIKLGNFLPPRAKWKEPSKGDVYSISGVAPTLDTDRGRGCKILDMIYERDLRTEQKPG